MKKIFFLFFFLFYPLCAEEPLRVGMELSYPPFETVCPNGEPCGISVDIAKELGKFLKRDVKIDNISFIGLIPALKNGKIDLIISSMTESEERKKAIWFSKPYATVGLALLISINSNLKDIQGANQPDRVIVVKSGTTGELYASKYLPKATVRVFDKESMCVLEVIQQKADAFVYDQLSVYTNWKKNPNTTRANLVPFQKESWGIGLREGNKELLEQVNQFIDKFRSEGGFEKLAEKYLPEQKAAFQQMGIPFIFSP